MSVFRVSALGASVILVWPGWSASVGPYPHPCDDDPTCCELVCKEDPYCCEFQWDVVCETLARHLCGELPDYSCRSALLLTWFPTELLFLNTWVPESNSSWPMCCHNGLPLVCTGGDHDGDTCVDDGDCKGPDACPSDQACTADGVCGTRPPFALYPIWVKFIADAPTININTCGTSGQGADSVIQVFAVGDDTSSEAACRSLIPIACGDDSVQCNNNKLTRLCVPGLVPGEVYYVLVGAKTREGVRDFDVLFGSPCTPFPGSNDACAFATPVQYDQGVNFNLNAATLDCDEGLCGPPADSDRWYEYVAPIGGLTYAHTCMLQQGATSLAVHEGCGPCALDGGEPVGCAGPGSSECGPNRQGSWVEFYADPGQCYRVRVAGVSQPRPIGTLRVTPLETCYLHAPVHWIDPPDGTVDARRPHPPDDESAQLGLDTILVELPGPSLANCWSFVCEGAALDSPNSLASVTESPGYYRYLLELDRAITPGATTRIRYNAGYPLDPSTTLEVIAHPGNVNGDEIVDASDVELLALALDGMVDLDAYSSDIDRSGLLTPLDLLDAVDLYNGAEDYRAWGESRLPESCP